MPLVDEIHLQRLYLKIEQIRYGDRLLVAFDLPRELERAAVPALILQPLVENSIRHAVARTSRPVLITVSARADEDRLLLLVEDDGPGEGNTGSGIGLRNVVERLNLRFGTDGTCEHVRRPTAITSTLLSIPLLLPTRKLT